MASVLMPQVKESPALTALKLPLPAGGVDSPLRLEPQQASVPVGLDRTVVKVSGAYRAEAACRGRQWRLAVPVVAQHASVPFALIAHV